MQNPPLICVLAGQSDMVGRGVPDDLSDEFVNSVTNSGHTTQFMYEIDWLSKEGLPSDSRREFRELSRAAQYSNAGQRYSFGPEWGIADSILGACARNDAGAGGINPRRNIYFIKFAAGSTNLHEDWAPGGELFSGLVDLVRCGAQKVAQEWWQESGCCEESDESESGRTRKTEHIEHLLLRDHTAFFWLQGHSDAGKAPMRASYGQNFTNFCFAVRGELLRMPTQEINAAEETSDSFCGTSSPNGLNFPIVASELDWPLDENSKSSRRFAKRLQEVNRALREACERLNSGSIDSPKSESDLAAQSPEETNSSNSVPCAFAKFPSDADWFRLSYHSDGHSDNEGLLSLGRNMGRHFCETFLFAAKKNFEN